MRTQALNRVFVPTLRAVPCAPVGVPFQLAGVAMGTRWSVRGYADECAEVRPEKVIARELALVVREMSQWQADSDLTRFNAAPRGSRHALPQAFSEVLSCALAIAAETHGAFDPTLGALVDLWGFGPQHSAPVPPPLSDLAAARDASGWRRLDFDVSSRRLTQPGGVRLDFAGIAKGYAVDRIAGQLRAAGLTSFLVEIGGELYGAGIKPDGQPWWVEIERPPGSNSAPTLAALHELSIATSGDYRRVATIEGRQVSHTIDPRTGRPLVCDLAAVTVVHRECMRADAYATALMVMGRDVGKDFADRCGLAAMFTLRTATGMEQVPSMAFARQFD